jgi:hypothetical protein
MRHTALQSLRLSIVRGWQQNADFNSRTDKGTAG